MREKVVPLLAHVYEIHLASKGYAMLSVARFFDALRLNTGMNFKISFTINGNASKETLGGHIWEITSTYIEGKTLSGILFYKNSFELVMQSKVLPKKEDEIIVSAEISLSENFKTALNDPSTDTFKGYKKKLEAVLNRTYQNLDGFIKANVNSFRKGSIVVNYELIFDGTISGKNTEDVEDKVVKATSSSVKDGMLGSFNVTKNGFVILGVASPQIGPRSSGKSLVTWAIVLIVSCVVIVILVLVLVRQWQRARRYKEFVGDMQANLPALKQNIYELDEIVDHATPRLERLKRESQYMSTFESIPRAKVVASETNGKPNKEAKQELGVTNRSFVVAGEKQDDVENKSVDRIEEKDVP